MKYLVRLYRLGEGDRREQDSVMLVEVEGDACREFAEDIAERAAETMGTAIAHDVRSQIDHFLESGKQLPNDHLGATES